MIRQRKASFSTIAIITITLCALVFQQPYSSAASDDDVGFGRAATMGAGPPKSEVVGSESTKVASRTGAYEYDFPIVVPPGRLGMQPKLSLSYNSQGRIYGGIASHWSLKIPEVRVDYSNGRLEAGVELRWTSDLAGGQSLVAVDEPSSPGSSPYRLFTKIPRRNCSYFQPTSHPELV